LGISHWITIGSMLIALLSLIATVYFGRKMMAIANKSADAASKSADIMRETFHLEKNKFLSETLRRKDK
jgi:hypothetical protein